MKWPIRLLALGAIVLGLWFTAACNTETGEIAEPERPAEPKPLESHPGEIIGDVVVVSQIPDAASSPYPDCAGRIVVKTSDGERLCTGVVFQDRQPTSFGRVGVGARVRLQVRPTDQVPRSEIARYRLVDHTDRFDLDPWWVDRIEVVGARLHKAPANPKINLAEVAAAESSYIRYALHANPAPMIGGVSNDFFFYGDRRFYRDDFWKEAPEDSSSIGIRECILQFHEFLAERDIELYVAMIPVASSIYPDYAVNQYFDPEIHEPPNEPVQAMFRSLGESGVRSVDLTSVFLRNRWTEFEGERYPIFRPNDTHWSPAGAKLAATEIARVVRAGTSYPELLRLPPPETFRETSQLMEFEADIVEILGAKYPHREVEIKPHLTPSHEVSGTGAAARWLASHEHPESPVHLIGDSFVHKLYATNSGLHAHLTRELGTQVNMFYRYSSGGQVLQEWVDSTDLSKAKIVIFATAEKYACVDHLWEPLRVSELP